MPLRIIVFAVIFGIAIGVAMDYVLGGNVVAHIAIAVVAALAAGWFVARKRG